MRLAVFGATGGTGAELTRLALRTGHSVTASARTPEKIGLSHDRLAVARSDVLDPDSLAAVVRGSDAVVSALGAPGNEPTTVYSSGAANILHIMREEGVRRFVGISAVPVRPRHEVGLVERVVLYPILYRLFGEGYADMRRMEQVLSGSVAEWTVVRPARLTDRPATGRYRMGVNDHLPSGRSISRADLAEAMLRLLTDPGAVRATVELAY